MHFHDPLNYIFNQPSKIKLLRHLVLYRGWFTGRELGRKVLLSHPIVHRALASLEKEGLVQMKNTGSSYLYSLSKDNWAVSHLLIPLFTNEQHLPLLFFQSLTKKISPYIISIILYGSIARKEEKSESDIDLLIIVPDYRSIAKVEHEIKEIVPETVKYFGNQTSPVIITKKDFIARRQKKDPFIQKIITEGKVIAGKSISEMFFNKFL